MLDQILHDVVVYIFTNPDRLVGHLFLAIIIVLAIMGLSFWSVHVFRAGILFAGLCFIFFFPAFAFPHLLDNLYYSLGLIDEFRNTPIEMKTITLLLLTNSVIAITYFVVKFAYDVLNGNRLTWKKADLEAEAVDEALRADLRKQAEALKNSTSAVAKE
ncbi:hypothetical protein [Paenibacillus sp. GXUN7292]|uniref:hypothetical protein n=1 Tax=Paenibacillus sp. GXUN7292 TaxID=3422499 RepID=UPI003D7C7EAF